MIAIGSSRRPDKARSVAGMRVLRGAGLLVLPGRSKALGNNGPRQWQTSERV